MDEKTENEKESKRTDAAKSYKCWKSHDRPHPEGAGHTEEEFTLAPSANFL